IFLLSIFALLQFLQSREITGKDTVLNRLNGQIAELTELLAMERAGKQDVADQLANLQASLASAEAERDRLKGAADSSTAAAGSAEGQIAIITKALENEKVVSQKALSQVEILNQQIAALRRQIGALEEALRASEKRDTESQTKIADLGRRLNVARLREILGNRPDITIVGDRFVFQSEVLFPSGSDEINEEGRVEMTKLADALKVLEGEIPPEIAWVLRVDGHTDARPLSGSGRFRNNWELSSARAIAVVRFLVDQGVQPIHLVAAGFGEFQPLVQGNDDAAYARNRRIELKLTER
ncbi:MAG: peptidoglycan -binding protein, partial [Rhizobiales bacterium]|nr:peptidoglycan -binding protein [Hyphomicrobiales bacterium]